jgi:Protein of unknown function (DUF3108)
MRRPLIAALAVSLVAHLLLITKAAQLWRFAPEAIDFPIDARLEPPQPATAPHRPGRKPPAPRPRPAPLHSHRPTPRAQTASPPPPPPRAEGPPSDIIPAVPAPEAPPETTRPDVTAGANPASAPSRPGPVPPNHAAETPPARPMLRELPPKLEIRYAVLTGDKGFKAGRASYTWVAAAGHYSLVNVIEATGLVSLFVSGRIVQVSEGSIDASGLKPEQYWLQRGRHRQDSARMDWTTHRLVMGKGGGEELPDDTQDLLSFPFQLAVTAQPGESPFRLPVADGRKLKRYSFKDLGLESLHLPDGDHRVQHLQGSRAGEGTLDVWLALDEYGVPLRVRMADRDGDVKMLEAEEIEAPGR